MTRQIIKRSVIVAGRKTSVSLEDSFWTELREAVAVRQTTISALVTGIDHDRGLTNLSSALRLFVVERLQAQVASLRAAKAQEPYGKSPAAAAVAELALAQDTGAG